MATEFTEYNRSRWGLQHDADAVKFDEQSNRQPDQVTNTAEQKHQLATEFSVNPKLECVLGRNLPLPATTPNARNTSKPEQASIDAALNDASIAQRTVRVSVKASPKLTKPDVVPTAAMDMGERVDLPLQDFHNLQISLPSSPISPSSDSRGVLHALAVQRVAGQITGRSSPV